MILCFSATQAMLAASIRGLLDVLEAAMIGVHLEKFVSDAKKNGETVT